MLICHDGDEIIMQIEVLLHKPKGLLGQSKHSACIVVPTQWYQSRTASVSRQYERWRGSRSWTDKSWRLGRTPCAIDSGGDEAPTPYFCLSQIPKVMMAFDELLH